MAAACSLFCVFCWMSCPTDCWKQVCVRM